MTFFTHEGLPLAKPLPGLPELWTNDAVFISFVQKVSSRGFKSKRVLLVRRKCMILSDAASVASKARLRRMEKITSIDEIVYHKDSSTVLFVIQNCDLLVVFEGDGEVVFDMGEFLNTMLAVAKLEGHVLPIRALRRGETMKGLAALKKRKDYRPIGAMLKESQKSESPQAYGINETTPMIERASSTRSVRSRGSIGDLDTLGDEARDSRVNVASATLSKRTIQDVAVEVQRLLRGDSVRSTSVNTERPPHPDHSHNSSRCASPSPSWGDASGDSEDVGDAELTLVVKDPGEDLGIRFLADLTVVGVASGGAADRAGFAKFIGGRVTHAQSTLVNSSRAIDALAAREEVVCLRVVMSGNVLSSPISGRFRDAATKARAENAELLNENEHLLAENRQLHAQVATLRGTVADREEYIAHLEGLCQQLQSGHSSGHSSMPGHSMIPATSFTLSEGESPSAHHPHLYHGVPPG